ncbi:MAG: hypothetical protein ACRC1W_09415 [Shewanella sp.]
MENALPGYQSQLEELKEFDKDSTGSSLHGYLQRRFEMAVDWKDHTGVSERLYKAFYSANSQYTPEQMCLLKKHGSPDVHYGLFAQQRRTWLAWYEDLLSQVKDRPWLIEPSPVSTLPDSAREEIINKITIDIASGAEELQRTAITKALKTEKALTARLLEEKAASLAVYATKVIEDFLSDGGSVPAFKDLRTDMGTYPNGFWLSPEVLVEDKAVYIGDKVKMKKQVVYNVRCITPFAVFPMPDCTSTQDGEGIFITDEMSMNSLLMLKGDDGVFDTAIDELLEEKPKGWWAGEYLSSDMHNVENHGGYLNSRHLVGNEEGFGSYSVVRFFGDIAQEKLNDLVISNKHKSDDKKPSIPVEIWMCGGRIIRAVRNNHPKGHRPIHTAGYEDVPRSFWKRGLYDILEDIERRLNKATRELVAHSATSLGFYGELDMTRMGRNPIANELPLNKIIKTDGDYTRGGHSALRLHSIDSKIPAAISLINHYEQEAQDKTGIRKFMSGATDLGTAGRTNGVVNALQTNSSKLIVMTQANVNAMMAEVVRHIYDLHLFYGKDKSLRGDLIIKVSGTDGLAKRELVNSKLEYMLQYGQGFLTAVDADGNPMLSPRDFKAMFMQYFEINGINLRYTQGPDQKLDISPQPQIGTGGMPAIDGRSNPVDISGGAGPIAP